MFSYFTGGSYHVNSSRNTLLNGKPKGYYSRKNRALRGEDSTGSGSSAGVCGEMGRSLIPHSQKSEEEGQDEDFEMCDANTFST